MALRNFMVSFSLNVTLCPPEPLKVRETWRHVVGQSVRHSVHGVFYGSFNGGQHGVRRQRSVGGAVVVLGGVVRGRRAAAVGHGESCVFWLIVGI
jgi:hypothetical protein